MREHRLHTRKSGRGLKTRLHGEECKWNGKQEQRGAADAMQDGDDARQREANPHQVEIDRSRFDHRRTVNGHRWGTAWFFFHSPTVSATWNTAGTRGRAA